MKLCAYIGELRCALAGLCDECPITPIGIEYDISKQKGCFGEGHIVIIIIKEQEERR